MQATPAILRQGASALSEAVGACMQVALGGLRSTYPPGSPSASLPDGELASHCVFVDNKRVNVDAAETVGFVGVLHDAYTCTEADLEASLTAAGVCLEPPDDDEASL